MTPKLKSLLFWLPLFMIFSVLSFLLINNAITLPFHNRAQDVVSFNQSDQAMDAQGHIVNNWQSNNYADDAVKAVVVVIAGFAYWRVLSTLIANHELKVIVFTVSVLIIFALSYVLSFILYWEF
jgi:hypothetical protein